MIRLWRVSNHRDLIGLGGELTDGRWHTAAHGKRIVYLSEHPALALIEALANLKGNPTLFPDKYQMLEIEVGNEIWRKRHFAFSADEPKAAGLSLRSTREEGDRWLRQNESALLMVPSFPAPGWNVLFNPLHPDAGSVRVSSHKWIAYDRRLFHVSPDAPRQRR